MHPGPYGKFMQKFQVLAVWGFISPFLTNNGEIWHWVVDLEFTLQAKFYQSHQNGSTDSPLVGKFVQKNYNFWGVLGIRGKPGNGKVDNGKLGNGKLGNGKVGNR